MLLLFDNDAFCKLGVCGLLDDAVRIVGTSLDECACLAALPYMLRRGPLVKQYGEAACLELRSVAQRLQSVPEGEANWLDRMTSVPNIDPGEAQLFANAATHGSFLATGDKRAIRKICEITGLADALNGRIIVLEAVLIGLTADLGVDTMRKKLRPLIGKDMMISVCFSEGNPDPENALGSYFREIALAVEPLTLWEAKPGT